MLENDWLFGRKKTEINYRTDSLFHSTCTTRATETIIYQTEKEKISKGEKNFPPYKLLLKKKKKKKFGATRSYIYKFFLDFTIWSQRIFEKKLSVLNVRKKKNTILLYSGKKNTISIELFLGSLLKLKNIIRFYTVSIIFSKLMRQYNSLFEKKITMRYHFTFLKRKLSYLIKSKTLGVNCYTFF